MRRERPRAPNIFHESPAYPGPTVAAGRAGESPDPASGTGIHQNIERECWATRINFTRRCWIVLFQENYIYPKIKDASSKPVRYRRLGENNMVNGLVGLAILFFVLALVFAILGARGVAGISMSIAKWLIILFIVLAIISLLL